MASKPATLDREPTSHGADFDEQLWPVNVLLLVLAALLAGLIVARADFHTRDPWANGYVYLAILGGVVLIFSLGAAVLRSGHQRRLQLAVLASLLLHAWLSLGVHEVRLPPAATPHPRADRDRELVSLPDYNFHQLDRPSEKQFFEQPLDATALPVIEAPRTQHHPPAPQVIPKTKPTKVEPLQPRPVEIERADASAPHRGQRLASLPKAASRQVATLEPALVPRDRPAAARSRPAAVDEPAPAVARTRPAVDLEPRLAMARSPQAGQPADLRAALTPPTISRPESNPTGAGNPPPAVDRLARSATGNSLPDLQVPVAPVPASKPGTSPTEELGPSASATGRTSQPATAASMSAPIGLPLAGPGFEGPTLPIESRLAGSPSGVAAPGFEQPQLNAPARARRDDMPLAGDSAVATTAGGRPTAAATPSGPPGDFEPAVAPRSRSERALPITAGAPTSGSFDDGPSLGQVPGGPVMRPDAGQSDGQPGGRQGGPLLAPSFGVPGALHKHGADALVDGTAATGRSATGRSVAAASGEPSRLAEPSAGPVAPTTGRMAGPSAPLLPSAAPASAGLAGPPTIEPGLPSRRARPESNLLAANTPRMILERSGGEVAIDSRVRDTAVPGLKQRDRAGRKSIAEQRGGSVETEQAVERGLEFLARFQAEDGSWRLHDSMPGFDYPVAEIPKVHSTTAATGLSLLAFLGAGYTHTDGPYRVLVERGLNHLLAHQRADGDLYEPQDGLSNSSAWLYSHGIASIALCEAYGMTRDRRLREPAQRALDFIAAAQNPDEGGWRYAPGRGSDTSVSGWQLMALKSGELAGLKVPRDCYSRVALWLDHAQIASAQGSRYVYMPRAENPALRSASTVMTAEALLMRQYMGWRRDHPEMIAGAQWIEQNLPQFGTATRDHPTGDRNAYYWYYGTQVMFQMQGRYWQAWNARLRPLLIESQATDGQFAGSWDPVYPLPDRYGYMVGRLYVTALHLLVLEVYYRHLPIYQTLGEAPAGR